MHESASHLRSLVTIALVSLVVGPGCTRKYFRQAADKDVEGVISQKNVFPDWEVKGWHVYPDPRARFADTFNPDRTPYPPDDYAARLLAPNPQKPTKKTGTGRIDGNGYLAMLQGWDGQNRADAPTDPAVVQPLAPGAPPARKKPDDAAPAPAGAQVRAMTKFDVAPTRPIPAPESVAAAHAGPPAPLPELPVAVARGPGGEFGPWAPARSAAPSLAAIRSASGGPVVGEMHGPSPLPPTVSEIREPLVLVAAGETELNGRTIPAVALIPIAAEQPVQPAEKIPAPKPLPGPMPGPLPLEPKPLEPKPLDPKQPAPVPGQPPGPPLGPAPGTGAPAPTGDPAADYLRALETGQFGYRLKIEQAIVLGVVNAREMQDRREDLYLAALSVTLSRFNFAVQAFLTEQVVYDSIGSALTKNFKHNTTTTYGTTGGLSKKFATGAMLSYKLANQLVLDLGSGKVTSVSNTSLSLIQPFLAGGGLAVTLEDLTQNERTMVYAMRSYLRFRRLFFAAVAAGPNNVGYTNNPYGLQGLAANLGRGVGSNLTAPNVGFLPLLLQQAIIDNQRKNVVELERLHRIYKAYGEGGQFAPLQVEQVEVQMLNGRIALLNGGGGATGIRQYLDALDNFKLQLGLPLTVHLELDDEPLRPIRLQLGRLEQVSAQVRALERDAERFDPATPVAQFRARWRTLLTESPLVRGTEFAKTIGQRWDSWSPAKLTNEQFNTRVNALLAERRKLLDARTDRQVQGVPEPEAEVKRLDRLNADIDLAEFERAVRFYEEQPWLKKAGLIVPQAVAFRGVFGAFQLLVIEARNDRQSAVRRQWPDLLPIPVSGGNILEGALDDAYTRAVQAGLTQRLDLMNARAQVVDAYRQIAVTANALQGVFNVEYDLTSSTPSGENNPFGFSAARSDNKLTFNGQLPLVRRAQRNNYRAALISYQRTRRTLMAFEDNIANDVRSDVRDCRTFAELYRIQQRAVELGYSQVDNAQLTQFAPLAAGVTLDAAAAAALTQQVLNTQSTLVSAQNTLYTNWVNYLTARINLYLDLEQMPLDDRGVWTDEFFNRADRQERSSPDERQPGGQPGERIHAPRPLDDGPGR
jgi:hypothetical protein